MTVSARVTANLLTTGRYVAVSNLVFFALAVQLGNGWLLCQIFLAALLLYLHIRVYFDRLLFIDLAYHHLNLEELDQTLKELYLQKTVENRPLAERAKGAIKLWKYLLYATAVQLFVLFLQS